MSVPNEMYISRSMGFMQDLIKKEDHYRDHTRYSSYFLSAEQVCVETFHTKNCTKTSEWLRVKTRERFLVPTVISDLVVVCPSSWRGPC